MHDVGKVHVLGVNMLYSSVSAVCSLLNDGLGYKGQPTLSFNKYVINLQLSFSPKLTTLSLDRALTSRLKRLAAMM